MLRVLHERAHRVPRPLSDVGGRGRRRRGRLRPPAGHTGARGLLLPVRGLPVGDPRRGGDAAGGRRRRPHRAQEAAAPGRRLHRRRGHRGPFFLDGERYLLGGKLLVVANAAQSVAMMLYNSYLPQIAPPEERDAVSSRGWAFGYAAGALVLVLNLVLYTGHDRFGVSEGMAVRICLASAGLWWGAFALVPLRRLRDRRAPEREAALPGFRQLAATVRDMRRHPLTLAFLLAYLVYNDGIQTVISQASVYGSKELGLEQSTLIVAVLLVQVLAVAGALAMGRLARRYGAKRTILGSLVAWTLTLAAGYFLPAGAPMWFFVLAAGIGLVLGGSQALSRSLFSHLVPPGKEAEYFSAYELSDRGMSWLGPLLFGLTYQLTGSYRDAIVSLVGFFALGFVLLARVPVRRAIADAGNPVPERI
ncbi:integral membrane protein [Streptomyces griseoflavus Tu4000]|uniref:Integral membrane protein n=1 Tax=Streptomyces griseoflavus Tu4000 TaxID=467200 RepID=D9XVU8_9ACTN|nr:integral membrane protein [Streptomyces griseoflavus Tu4000]